MSDLSPLSKLGCEKNGGNRLFCVSGHVAKPGVYELPNGTTLREIIYDHAGGIPNGRKLKAVIPGGISAPLLTPDQLDVKMDFDSLKAVGSMAGSGGIIVMDDTTDMVWAVLSSSTTGMAVGMIWLICPALLMISGAIPFVPLVMR